MYRELDVMAPKGALFSLLCAAVAFPGTLLAAVAGQGLGAVLGGCGWVGISTPIHLPVWALVNQPTLHFSSLPAATGYWWASWLVPLAIATAALPLCPRPRSLAAEIVVLQAAWAAAVVGVSWLPLLDPTDGHLGRWLALRDLPAQLLLIAPVVALPTAIVVSHRLLALLRSVRRSPGRGVRLATVGLHLVLPASIWIGLATLLRGAPAVAPSLAVALPVAAALAVAWRGYPPAFPHRLEELGAASFARVALAFAVVAGLVWLAGRPLTAGHCAGILWGQPGAFNNVRPWIDATPMLTGVGRDPASSGSGADVTAL